MHDYERKYFQLLESFDENSYAPVVQEEAIVEDCSSEIIDDLDRLLLKFNSIQNPGEGEFALGFEDARMKFSEMLENIIRDYTERSNG